MCFNDYDILLKNTKIIDIKTDNNKRKCTYITKILSNDVNIYNNIFMIPFYGKINKINIINNDHNNYINSILLKINKYFDKKIDNNVYNFDTNIICNINENDIQILYYKLDYFILEYKNILYKNNIKSDYIKYIYNNCIELLNNKINNINKYYIILCIIKNENNPKILNSNIFINIDYELLSNYIIIPTMSNSNNNIYDYDYKCYIDNVNNYNHNNIIVNKNFKYIDKELFITKKSNIIKDLCGFIYNNDKKILFIKLNFSNEYNDNIKITVE
ncbi:hypothetical protein AMV010 [Betaentomopoxvirus amoorei]|uniref:AMV010 n=1 Tax=Amsacta moorei entomopoxvirus TaxID=28321 RepID=Q9EN36_AMEPV|nr:hypothetical protein AMV010 [Amsacta moorei entomopoxvirus]AAG02716.1 AMV010 [Amsacta moorei entomopoxvirus]